MDGRHGVSTCLLHDGRVVGKMEEVKEEVHITICTYIGMNYTVRTVD